MLQEWTVFFLVVSLSQVSSFPIQCEEVNNNKEESQEIFSKRQINCSTMLQGTAPSISPKGMSPEERKKLQARLFEGLLHFGTIVNHIDTFIMDKSKVLLKSLGKMAASEEDKRFNM